MIKRIHKTIQMANKTDYLVLHIVKHLNKDEIIYDGIYYNFEKFIAKVESDTKGFFSTKVRDNDELKTILISLFSSIQKVIGKKELTKELEHFIDTKHGYDISNKLSINLLNFLVNYNYYYGFDTLKCLDIIYPELIQEIKRKKIPDPPQILDAVRDGGYKQEAPPRRPEPAAQAGGRRKTRSSKGKHYPFQGRRNGTRRNNLSL